MKRQTEYDCLLLRKYLEELDAKYPRPAESYTPHEAAKINFCHSLEIDHLYRIFWGSRTELMSFQNGHIELDAYVERENYEKDGDEKYRFLHQIEAWFANRYLRKARSFRAHIYSTINPPADGRIPREEAFVIRPAPYFRGPIYPVVEGKIDEWSGQLGVAGELIHTPEDDWPEDMH
jgi:hypothetical protein